MKLVRALWTIDAWSMMVAVRRGKARKAFADTVLEDAILRVVMMIMIVEFVGMFILCLTGAPKWCT